MQSCQSSSLFRLAFGGRHRLRRNRFSEQVGIDPLLHLRGIVRTRDVEDVVVRHHFQIAHVGPWQPGRPTQAGLSTAAPSPSTGNNTRDIRRFGTIKPDGTAAVRQTSYVSGRGIQRNGPIAADVVPRWGTLGVSRASHEQQQNDSQHSACPRCRWQRHQPHQRRRQQLAAMAVIGRRGDECGNSAPCQWNPAFESAGHSPA